MEINGRPRIVPITITWDYRDRDKYLVSEDNLKDEDAVARFS